MLLHILDYFSAAADYSGANAAAAAVAVALKCESSEFEQQQHELGKAVCCQ